MCGTAARLHLLLQAHVRSAAYIEAMVAVSVLCPISWLAWA